MGPGARIFAFLKLHASPICWRTVSEFWVALLNADSCPEARCCDVAVVVVALPNHKHVLSVSVLAIPEPQLPAASILFLVLEVPQHVPGLTVSYVGGFL